MNHILPKMLSNLTHQLKSHLTSGQLNLARGLFDKIPNPNLYSLTLLISAYTKHNPPQDSIQIYRKLWRNRGICNLYNLLLLAVVRACALSSEPIKAKEIHQDIIGFGFGSDLPLGNTLIDMYGKCGLIDGAKRVSEELPEKDVITTRTSLKL